MNSLDVILNMFPFYITGLIMFYATYKSEHRDLLRIESKALAKWCAFLILFTAFRVGHHKFMGYPPYPTDSGVGIIPWKTTPLVFWEDMCHALPLVLIGRFIGNVKWYSKAINRALLLFIMLAFGLGHVYEGYSAVFQLSFVVPWTMKVGQRRGFGTVMLGHILFDLSSHLSMYLVS